MKKYSILIAIVLVLLCIAAATVLPGLRIRSYPNDGNPPDSAAYILDETTTNKHITHDQLRFRMTNGLATTQYVNSVVSQTSAELWTNDAGFVHLKTNGPIVLGTNQYPAASPAAFYMFTDITNDSMSGMILELNPKNGVGNNRSGFCVFVDRGDELGGFSLATFGLNRATSSNHSGAYFGNVPFGSIGSAESAGPGDSVGNIGVNIGTNSGMRYALVGVTGGPMLGNTNIGVFGHGSTNSAVAVGGYFELGNGTSTTPDAKYPFSSALILNNRQTGKRLMTAFTNSDYEVFSLLSNGHAQLNSNDLYTLKAGSGVTFTTNGTELTVAATGTLTGSTNYLNLSVQAAKLPNTNYPGIDAGWQDWELVYFKTNAEGSIASLTGSWQFVVPLDYATNSLKVRIYSLLTSTNGPNTSNTIFRVSTLRATPSDTTDLHINLLTAALSGTNIWTASATATNRIQSVIISLGTNSMLAAGDWCLLQLDRDAASDTYGGATSVVGLQLEYTR